MGYIHSKWETLTGLLRMDGILKHRKEGRKHFRENSKGNLEGMMRPSRWGDCLKGSWGTYWDVTWPDRPVSLIPFSVLLSLNLCAPAPLGWFLSLPRAFVLPILSACTTLSWLLVWLPLLFIQIVAQMSTVPSILYLKILFCLPMAFKSVGKS